MSPSSLRSSTEPRGLTLASPEPDPRALALPSSGSSHDPRTSSLRKPHRVRTLRRSWSTLMPGSRSLEALIEKTKAAFSGRSDGQNSHSQDPQKVQRTFSAKSLAKSVSQGSVASSSSRGVSLLMLESTSPRLDSGTWRCHGPFSHCFLRRKSSTHGSDEDSDMPSLALLSKGFGGKESPAAKSDRKAEQSDAPKPISDMSLKERLAHINSMKGKTYSLRTGFALARKDALEMMSVLRCSVRRRSGGDAAADAGEAGVQTSYQPFLMQAKVLSGACGQMATEYNSPEELLLTLTHSFHSLCCLMQACVSVVEGLSAERQRHEVVAKVDEVVVNYACLLKAAEVAAGGSPSDQSVNALTHYSASTSAIINTLTHSLETLLDNKLSFCHDYRF